MKKLEDIEKKDIFEVPEGYFDTLPTLVQSRVVQRKGGWNPTLVFGLKYALPVLLVAIGVFWLSGSDDESPERLLASVSTEDIAEYIHSMDISNDELLDALDYSKINADSLNLPESHVIFDETELTEEIIELETEL